MERITNEQKKMARKLVSKQELPPEIESSVSSIENGIVSTHDKMTQREVAQQILDIAEGMISCNDVSVK